jgi:RHS repeat-associated protein
MEWYFYGVDGRLIGTYVPGSYYGTLFTEQSTNVYFGGRTLQAQGQTGMKQDRLGTTSYTATAYAPYGDTGIFPPPYGDGLGFTGYYRDGTSTGLDYAQQRYYAPSIGRFTSPDPYKASAAIARPQSWDRYAYVENDPVNFRDPAGLEMEWGGDVWGWDVNVGQGEPMSCVVSGTVFHDPFLCSSSMANGFLGGVTEPAWGVAQRAWVEDLFLGDTDFVDSIDYGGGDQYTLQLTPAGVFAFLPQLAGVGATTGGVIILAGGPVTWTTVAGAIVVAGMTYATIIALKDAVEKAKQKWDAAREAVCYPQYQRDCEWCRKTGGGRECYARAMEEYQRCMKGN